MYKKEERKGNLRSSLLLKNVLASFFVKGWAAVVALLLVPLTLNCLGVYQNGVWLLVSSLLMWIDQMDIGLGNGLRNRLAVHLARGETSDAQKVVSSTVAMLLCIVLPVLFVLLLLVWKTDIYALLNVSATQVPELRLALMSAVTLVCMTFVLKFIGNVYMGVQMPAVSNLLMALGQTVALIATWLLYVSGKASFLYVVVANTMAPLLVYMLAYPYTFYFRYPMLRPALRCVDLSSVLETGSLGVKFFWLQIAGVIQFMTANLLISNFFTPEMVTPYQIAYRYISLVLVAFSVVCMPFWNATTDAYERGDIDWIRKANHRMSVFTMIVAVGLLLMTLVSPWVYSVWIGDSCEVPLSMTAMMAVYVFLLVVSLRYSYFLNGIGALRMQLYMTVMAVVFIPLAWGVSSYTHDIVWFMAVMCFCNVPGIVANAIQFNKILNGKASGIWRI